jgi:hypothetical protein
MEHISLSVDMPSIVPKTKSIRKLHVVHPHRTQMQRSHVRTQTCHYCRKMFSIPQYDKFTSHENIICSDCIKVRDDLYATDKNDPRASYVTITFGVNVEDHDGYCSDGYNRTTINKNVTKTFAVPPGFAVVGKTDATESDKMIYFVPSSVPHGNGHCGCQTTFYVVSAKWVHHAPHTVDDLRVWFEETSRSIRNLFD